jgi:hypothetical protein
VRTAWAGTVRYAIAYYGILCGMWYVVWCSLTVVLDRICRAESDRFHRPRLANPMRTLYRLHLNRWIPPRIEQEHCQATHTHAHTHTHRPTDGQYSAAQSRHCGCGSSGCWHRSIHHSPCEAHCRLSPSPPARRLSSIISTLGFVLNACSIALR